MLRISLRVDKSDIIAFGKPANSCAGEGCVNRRYPKQHIVLEMKLLYKFHQDVRTRIFPSCQTTETHLFANILQTMRTTYYFAMFANYIPQSRTDGTSLIFTFVQQPPPRKIRQIFSDLLLPYILSNIALHTRKYDLAIIREQSRDCFATTSSANVGGVHGLLRQPSSLQVKLSLSQ